MASALGVLAERDGRIIDVYAHHDRARLVRVWRNLAQCSRYRSPFPRMCGEIDRLLQFHVFEGVNRCTALVRCNHHE